VLRVNMADSGLSIFFLRSSRIPAHDLPESRLTIKNELGVERRTASIIEQRKETKRARKRYKKSNIMTRYKCNNYSIDKNPGLIGQLSGN